MNEKLIDQFISIEGVQDIIRIFTEENVEICFVGGCIRDVLSGIQSHDIDFAINCAPEETIKVLNKNIVTIVIKRREPTAALYFKVWVS